MPPGYIPPPSHSVINEVVEGMTKVVAGGSVAPATDIRFIHTSEPRAQDLYGCH